MNLLNLEGTFGQDLAFIWLLAFELVGFVLWLINNLVISLIRSELILFLNKFDFFGFVLAKIEFALLTSLDSLLPLNDPFEYEIIGWSFLL